MTTIAWDGKTLAADRQATINNRPLVERDAKIKRIRFLGKPALCGVSGSLTLARKVVKWIMKGCDEDDTPSRGDNENFEVMVITNDDVLIYPNNFFAESMGNIKFAIGSGANYAEGAMAFGASAVEAVEISATLDIYTGYGIDTLTLKKGK